MVIGEFTEGILQYDTAHGGSVLLIPIVPFSGLLPTATGIGHTKYGICRNSLNTMEEISYNSQQAKGDNLYTLRIWYNGLTICKGMSKQYTVNRHTNYSHLPLRCTKCFS